MPTTSCFAYLKPTNHCQRIIKKQDLGLQLLQHQLAAEADKRAALRPTMISFARAVKLGVKESRKAPTGNASWGSRSSNQTIFNANAFHSFSGGHTGHVMPAQQSNPQGLIFGRIEKEVPTLLRSKKCRQRDEERAMKEAKRAAALTPKQAKLFAEVMPTSDYMTPPLLPQTSDQIQRMEKSAERRRKLELLASRKKTLKLR